MSDYIRKDRLPVIPLFELTEPTLHFQKITAKLESNRMDKVFIKKLEDLNTELRSKRSNERDEEMIKKIQEAKKYFIENRNLMKWAIKKGIDFNN